MGGVCMCVTVHYGSMTGGSGHHGISWHCNMRGILSILSASSPHWLGAVLEM